MLHTTYPCVLALQVTGSSQGQPIYLFYYPDCERLAERVVQASQGRIQLGRIRWG